MGVNHDKRLLAARDRLLVSAHKAADDRAKLRAAIVAAIDDGMSKGHVARLFGCSEKMVYKHLASGRAEADGK